MSREHVDKAVAEQVAAALQALSDEYANMSMAFAVGLEWVEDRSTEAAIVMQTTHRCYGEVSHQLKKRAAAIRAVNAITNQEEKPDGTGA